MKKSLSSFAEYALTRAEMKEVKGGETCGCLPNDKMTACGTQVWCRTTDGRNYELSRNYPGTGVPCTCPPNTPSTPTQK